MAFVKNLKRLRREKGFTQAELAEIIDMSVRGYQKYEQGESWPGPAKLRAIAEALSCSVSDLYADPLAKGATIKEPSYGDPGVIAEKIVSELRKDPDNFSHGMKAQIEILKAQLWDTKQENEQLKALIGPHAKLLKKLISSPERLTSVYASAGIRQVSGEKRKSRNG